MEKGRYNSSRMRRADFWGMGRMSKWMVYEPTEGETTTRAVR